MMRPINDFDTTVKSAQEGICEECGYLDELKEITYTPYEQIGEYMQPKSRKTDKVCDNCIEEYY